MGRCMGDMGRCRGDTGRDRGERGEREERERGGGEAVEGTLGADEQRGQELLDLGGCRLVRVRERRFRV